jgi:carbon storage regulator
MLVLTREPGESVKIDEEIEVVVLGVEPKRKQVRLGFKAPRKIIINRLEVHERIEADKKRVNNNNKDSILSD